MPLSSRYSSHLHPFAKWRRCVAQSSRLRSKQSAIRYVFRFVTDASRLTDQPSDFIAPGVRIAKSLAEQPSRATRHPNKVAQTQEAGICTWLNQDFHKWHCCLQLHSLLDATEAQQITRISQRLLLLRRSQALSHLAIKLIRLAAPQLVHLRASRLQLLRQAPGLP